VEAPRKKADVKFGADYDAVGEPEETIQTNMKEEEITEESLQQIEEFLLNEEETEEERELRLIAERRKRREEILQKHSASLPATPDQLEPVAMTPHVSVIDTPLAGSQDPVIEKDDEDEEERSSRLPVASRDVDVENEAAALMAEREAVAAAEKRETISFDIFSSSPTTTNIPMKPGTLGKRVMKNALLEGEDPLLQSNWDDGEGYYKTRIGEIICDRYHCYSPLSFLPSLSSLSLTSKQVPHNGRSGKRSLLHSAEVSRSASAGLLRWRLRDPPAGDPQSHPQQRLNAQSLRERAAAAHSHL
jgi:hypothetical protein